MTLIKRLELTIKFMLNPKEEWKTVETLPYDLRNLVILFLLPMAALIAIACFIGGVLWSEMFFGAIFKGIGVGASFAAAVIGTAFILDRIIHSFEVDEDNGKVIRLVIFSYAPVFFLGSLAFIIPQLNFIFYPLCLYGIYLFWLGAKYMLRISEEKLIGFVFISIIINAAVIAISMVVINGFFGLFY